MTFDASELRSCQEDFLGDLILRRVRVATDRVETFRPPLCGTLEDRWWIYADGYVARIAEALEDDYPAVRRILGEGPFRSLAARYVSARPPRSFDLGREGDRLSAFLDRDPLTERLPFLPDLARLERALADAFVAPDAEPLVWSDLQVLGAEAVADLRLALMPGTAVIRSAWPIQDLRACRDRPDEEIDLEVEGRPTTVLVWRRGFDAVFRTLNEDEDEAALLEAVALHGSLAALQADGRFDHDVPRLIDGFRRFVGEGLFRKEDTWRRPAPEEP